MSILARRTSAEQLALLYTLLESLADSAAFTSDEMGDCPGCGSYGNHAAGCPVALVHEILRDDQSLAAPTLEAQRAPVRRTILALAQSQVESAGLVPVEPFVSAVEALRQNALADPLYLLTEYVYREARGLAHQIAHTGERFTLAKFAAAFGR